VRDRVWQQRWDLVIIDEAHKCSARTTSGGVGRDPSVDPTKRYELAARLAWQADHLLLLTATPHHGDRTNSPTSSAFWTRSLSEPHRLGEKATAIRKTIFKLGKDCPGRSGGSRKTSKT